MSADPIEAERDALDARERAVRVELDAIRKGRCDLEGRCGHPAEKQMTVEFSLVICTRCGSPTGFEIGPPVESTRDWVNRQPKSHAL